MPPDDDERHLPRARFHARLAGEFGPVELVEPLYGRCPTPWRARDEVKRREGGVPVRRGNVDLRKLELRDLNDIERIERESYPTPWSRSMFAGELAKPSSLSLGAFDRETGALVGYLVISRYVDAWHVMNVAVTTEYRRRGSRAPCSSGCSS